MLRFIARTVIALIANAIGLIVAAWLLDDMTLNATGLLIDVLVFTVVAVLIQPFVAKSALKNGSALSGSSALIASFVALLVTVWWSDDLRISGLTTWLLAAGIVWGASVLAAMLLPLVLFKKWLAQRPG